MTGALFVGGVICCCVGHPWIGAGLIWLSGRLYMGCVNNRPAR